MYKKILVPLDGSATAEAVLPYVEALAAGFKTAVELLSVIDIGAMTTHLAPDKVRNLDAIIAGEEKKVRGVLGPCRQALLSCLGLVPNGSRHASGDHS